MFVQLPLFNAAIHILWEAFHRAPAFKSRSVVTLSVKREQLVLDAEYADARVVVRVPGVLNGKPLTDGSYALDEIWENMKGFEGESLELYTTEEHGLKLKASQARVFDFVKQYSKPNLSFTPKYFIAYETMSFLRMLPFLMNARARPEELRRTLRGAVLGDNFLAISDGHRVHVQHDIPGTGYRTHERFVGAPVLDALRRASDLLSLPATFGLELGDFEVGVNILTAEGVSLELSSRYIPDTEKDDQGKDVYRTNIYSMREKFFPWACCTDASGNHSPCRWGAYPPTDVYLDGQLLKNILSELLKVQRNAMEKDPEESYRKAAVRLTVTAERPNVMVIEALYGVRDKVLIGHEQEVHRTQDGVFVVQPFCVQLNTHYFLAALHDSRSLQLILQHVHPFHDTEHVFINHPEYPRFSAIMPAPLDGEERLKQRQQWELEQTHGRRHGRGRRQDLGASRSER